MTRRQHRLRAQRRAQRLRRLVGRKPGWRVVIWQGDAWWQREG